MKIFDIVFLGLRLSRVYPLHILTTCLLVPMTLLPEFTGGFHPNAFSSSNLAANFLLVQNWLFFFSPSAWLDPGWSWNVPAWSLSVEWFAHLAFPFLVILMTRLQSSAALLAAAVMPLLDIDTIFGGLPRSSL